MTGLDSDSLEGSAMYCLGRLPPLMQKGRDLLSLQISTILRASMLSSLSQELRSLYLSFQPVLSKFRTRWYTIDETLSSEALTPFQKRCIHCNHSRMLAFALAIGLAINYSLVTLIPTDLYLKHEIVQLVEEILDLADIIVVYRPLASLSTTVSLSAALAGINAVGSVLSVSHAAELTSKIEGRLEDDMAQIYGETVKITDEDRKKYRRPFVLWTPE